MALITDGFKDIFLAGVGAMALGAEKSQELVNQLIAKGEITVEQGKQINSELMHQANDATANIREDVIKAQMATMTKEQRDAFAAMVAEAAAQADADSKLEHEEAVEVEAEVVAEEQSGTDEA